LLVHQGINTNPDTAAEKKFFIIVFAGYKIESYRYSSCLKMKRVSLTKRGKEFADKLIRVLATGEIPARSMAPEESA
jgi:hypothetical protein